MIFLILPHTIPKIQCVVFEVGNDSKVEFKHRYYTKNITGETDLFSYF